MSWNPMRKKDYATVAAAAALMACGQIPGLGTDGGSTGVEAKWSSLYSSYFQSCGQCHAPGAPGRPVSNEIEQTLDFSTAAKGYTSVTSGSASGLVGNTQSCNGVPFVVSGHPETSLIVAVVDQPTRNSYTAPSNGDCNSDTVTDMTVKQGFAPPDGFVTALKTWISNGAPND